MTERRTSRQTQSRASTRTSDPDVFSDNYALGQYEGRRTDQATPITRQGSMNSNLFPQRSNSMQQSTENDDTPIGRSRLSQRSSTTRSLTSRTDEQAPQSTRASASEVGRTSSTAHHSLRSVSTVMAPRAQSPYQGATGPSHPYGMYSQDISVTRTPSAATTSTIRRPERTYSGPDGPTQPYGMYAQNTLPEDEPLESESSTLVAAGFPGTRQNYRRRLGPDGEDADDLIGPDGYTEQLPPYTRYANDLPPKGERVSMPAPTNPPYQNGQNAEQPTEQPREQTADQVEYMPSEYYMPPANRSPTTSDPFDDRPAHVVTPNSTNSPPPKTEASSFKERVKEKGSKRVCCGLVPCWLFVFVVVVFLIAVLLGGIVGGVVAHRGDPYPKTTPTDTQSAAAASTAPYLSSATSSATDAEVIATPTGLPPLPTGDFSLVLDNPPSANSNSCLTDATQNNAWDCSTGAELDFTISLGSGNMPSIDIQYPIGPNTPLRYGAQPPELTSPATLQLVKDKRQPGKGPAYHFAQFFNKTVIVRERDFPAGATKVKKRDDGDDRSDWTEVDMASPTDRPWFCFWNNTVLEGFIYVTQNEEDADDNGPSIGSDEPTPTSSAAAKRGVSTAPPYPKHVKISELRPVPRPRISPYCQQMQILDNWRPGPLNTPPVQLQENEFIQQHQYQRYQSDPPSSQPTYDHSGSKRLVRRQGGECKCIWQC